MSAGMWIGIGLLGGLGAVARVVLGAAVDARASGAFTTFSTWLVDARLLGGRLGAANLAAALALGLLAAWLGRALF